MNLYSNFENNLNFLLNINTQQWKDPEIKTKLEDLIHSANELPFNKVFYDKLMRLSANVYIHSDFAEKFEYANKIKKLALSVINIQNLPPEIFEVILSETAPNSEIFQDLNNIKFVSKKVLASTEHYQKRVANQHADLFFVYGCKTAKKAVKLAIDLGLKSINLGYFQDLTEEDLKYLCDSCKGIENLTISSPHIKQLPEGFLTLKTLTLYHCENLTQLPHSYTNLTKLGCIDCPNLTQLPPTYTNLTDLECRFCPDLTELPDAYTKLIKLNCICCLNLTQLPPTYTNLTKLCCISCPNLTELPDAYTKLIKLNCTCCPNLTQLPPTYTNLTKLDCSYCLNLRELPDTYTNLTNLDCFNCPNLRQLPPEYRKLIRLTRAKSD